MSEGQNWFQTHRQAIVVASVATAAVAAGASLYYLSQTSPADNQKESQKKKSKKKKSKKKKDTEKDTESVASEEDSDSLTVSAADIALMDPDARSKLAGTLKNRGNEFHSQKDYRKAILYYTKAIECEEDAVFYSNRAACYTALDVPEKVIEDCTKALKLDSGYVKALNRRAVAYEKLSGSDNLYHSLCDFTAAAILDQFKTPTTQAAVERVMKELAAMKASEIMKNRTPREPSKTFIRTYLEAFHPKPATPLPENPSQGDKTLALAYSALEAKDYTHAATLFIESLEQGITTSAGQSDALNMRGNMRFIQGETVGALDDLNQSISLNPNQTHAYITRASVYMESMNATKAYEDFEEAIRRFPEDPDVYYHRGQVNFILGQFDKAQLDYKKSSELDPNSTHALIQLSVAKYKNGKVPQALHAFQGLVKQFPDSAEVHNYYGELLMDQKNFEESVEILKTSVELGKNKNPPNVLPMINLSLALLQWKQDYAQAEQICREAVTLDPTCDTGLAALAQLLLQQNKIPEALEVFEKSIELARNENELINALTYESASRAQMEFVKNYPEQAKALGLMVD